jgi:tetrahydromethanopterin S-methyltransferase subunit E
MTIEDDDENVSSEPDKPRQRWNAYALTVVILILAALFVMRFTLPLLGGSTVVFFVVAGACWAAIFAGTFAVTVSLGRRDRKSD